MAIKKKSPFYNRILFWLLAPVMTVGIACSTLLVTYMSDPMKEFLGRQFDANLRLASILGLRTCEESFNYLLDLRLEKNAEMNQVMQNEAMEEIKAASDHFPQVHLMVLSSGRLVEACSLPDAPAEWEGPSLDGLDDAALAFDFGDGAVRSHVQFFPFWNWHIISFVFEKDYEKPIQMAYTITHSSALGVFLAVVGALLVVFHLFIHKPLNRLVAATDGVAEGRLFKIDEIPCNELGRLTASFNDMVDSLEHEKAAVRTLIHQLKESEALFRSQFEFGNIGIAITKENGAWVRANERLCRMLGYSEKELHGKTWSQIFHPVDLEAGMTNYNRMLAGGIESFEMDIRLFHKNGNVVFTHLSVSCFRNPDQSIRFVIASILDITDRIRAGEELHRLRNYLSNIIDSMPSVLIGVDADGRVTQWNREAQRATGISSEEAEGRPLNKAFPRLAAEMTRVSEAMRYREVRGDIRQPRKENGETRYEDITIYPLVADVVEGAVIRVDDVTERVRLEEMMIQGEKMLSVGGLAAGMAHEINNPLAGMLQTARVMADRLGERLHIPANRKAAEAAGATIEAIGRFMEARRIPRMLAAIHDSGMRVAEIVDNMLSFARKSEAPDSFHRLETLLDKTLELAAADYDLKKQYDFRKIEIRREYAPDLPAVPCQGAKIQQVLLNILGNGAQAMREAGVETPRFIVRTRHEEKRQMARMELEDNGPGMDEGARKRVFEPFFTTKPVGVGTGLGLSVSYFIITENHGGEMTVESRPGAGAKFIIRLPMKGEAIGRVDENRTSHG